MYTSYAMIPWNAIAKSTSHRMAFTHQSPIAFSISRSILTLHFDAKVFIAHIVHTPAVIHITPSPKNRYPFVIALIKGSDTIVPTHEKIFRTKLFSAMPG
jgi:hypothetical protein